MSHSRGRCLENGSGGHPGGGPPTPSMFRMERAEFLKLYLIGALSLASLVVSGLVNAAVIPVDNRVSQGTQYLVVGVLLGLVFGFFGGFEDLASRIRGLGRRSTGQSAEGAVAAETRSGLMVFGRFDTEFVSADQAIGKFMTADSDGPQTSVLPAPSSSPEVRKRPATEVSERASTALSGRRATDVVPQPATEAEVFDTVARHEAAIVERLVSDGVLTGDGPITDDDVGIMLLTSVISAELSEQLLGLIDGPNVDGASKRPGELANQTVPAIDYRPPEQSA